MISLTPRPGRAGERTLAGTSRATGLPLLDAPVRLPISRSALRTLG